MSNTVLGGIALKAFPPEFRFEAKDHAYLLGTRRIPSFSQVVKLCGYVDDRYYTDEHRIRGTNVHDGVRLYNKGTLDWSDLDDAYMGYILAYEKLLKDWNITPQFYESPLYHPELLYGVTPDIIGTCLDGIPAVWELKSGQLIKHLVSKQTAAQAMALRAWEIKPIYRRRWGVTLNADGSYNKPVEFTDPMDEITFKANLITAQDKLKHGLGGY